MVDDPAGERKRLPLFPRFLCEASYEEKMHGSCLLVGGVAHIFMRRGGGGFPSRSLCFHDYYTLGLFTFVMMRFSSSTRMSSPSGTGSMASLELSVTCSVRPASWPVATDSA